MSVIVRCWGRVCVSLRTHPYRSPARLDLPRHSCAAVGPGGGGGTCSSSHTRMRRAVFQKSGHRVQQVFPCNVSSRLCGGSSTCWHTGCTGGGVSAAPGCVLVESWLHHHMHAHPSIWLPLLHPSTPPLRPRLYAHCNMGQGRSK